MNAFDWLETHVAEITDDSAIGKQKRKCAHRFNVRYAQFEAGILSYGDILSALRDAVLFLQSIPVKSETLLKAVKDHGADYGLRINTDGIVSAELSREGWFPNAAFVRAAYGKEGYTIHHEWSLGDKRLYDTTGYTQYRSFEQKTAVHTALDMPAGHTLLLTLPTGAGKSLISQMACANAAGMTLLIVPTTALGQDQFNAARSTIKNTEIRHNIFCYCGDSANAHLPRILEAIQKRTLKLLVTSPEAIIKNNMLRSAIEKAADANSIDYMIIDEAHIVQDWGSLFRPDFQFMSMIRAELLRRSNGSMKTILLSATLTEESIQYLRELFSEDDRWIALRCDALRKEPRYMVDSQQSSDKHIERVLHYARLLPKPMLIYCTRPKDATDWQRRLEDIGFSNVETFTGLTPDNERERIINRWDADDLDIIIATSAFGMGVDKPDVRTVMHVMLPESLNRFYQEVGRGGRDGLPCLSILCNCPPEEQSLLKYMVNSRILTVENMIDRWMIMLQDREAERVGDTIILDPSQAPSYFTKMEREQRGVRNMHWNIHVILFFVRHKFLRFVDARYDNAKRKYYIKVKLEYVALLNSKTRLNEVLSPLRQHELELSQEGYNALRNMIRAGKNGCYAEFFSKLYPYADLACGGCPGHDHSYSEDEPPLLHNQVGRYGQIDLSITEHPAWCGRHELMVSRISQRGYSVTRETEMAVKLNRHGIGIWVAPHCTPELAKRFDGLVLLVKEAEWLVKKDVSIFSRGVLISFTDNDSENRRLIRLAEKLRASRIPIVYHVNPNMIVESMNRPIGQIVNANLLTEEEVEEEFDV